MGILFALAKALEARDDNTSSHSLNVTRYSMMLGEQLGLDEDELRALSQGGLRGDATVLRSDRCFTPFLIAVKP